ncbi:hypothetical protein ACFU6K_07710 [Kitasatospora sp. NPDC057512]|uniref:preATP grasp domain-containing protein n=1 Tax=Kitasatospora sp. NPDC057512 TaxID=3346154 RepID=UPI0036B1E2EE
MKILIANDIDESLWLRKDGRTWSQRVFWFADEGDLVILSDHPDEDFLRHVCGLRGIDPTRVAVRVCPPGRRNGNRLIAPDALLDPNFIADIAVGIGAGPEIVSLFPSAMVSEFAARIGLGSRPEGSEFLAQGGSELANSKATFRALAGGAGVATAPGAVCRSKDEAVHAMEALIGDGHDVMVKMAHRGAGVGNELVLNTGSTAPANIGARHHYRLDAGPDAIGRYWEERWLWASAEGRYPVVVEQVLNVRQSLYVELLIGDASCDLRGVGVLSYAGGRITCETLGLAEIPEPQARKAVDDATRLADVYRAMGYRGYFCADAVMTDDMHVLFTEVNARTTTGSHLHEFLDVQAKAVTRENDIVVRQYADSPDWSVRSTEQFLTGLANAGLTYSAASGTGIFMAIPAFPEQSSGSFLYVIACNEQEEEEYLRKLDELFRSIPDQG